MTTSPQKLNSTFISETLIISNWLDLEPYIESLRARKINLATDLEEFIQDYSDLLSVFFENYSWAFIRMTCDTADPEKVKLNDQLSSEVLPKLKAAQAEFNRKILNTPLAQTLDPERYGLLLKKFKNAVALFSEKNTALEKELAPLESRYRQIVGGLSVNIKGATLTLTKSSVILNHTDRKDRHEAWLAIQAARASVKNSLDELFSTMVKLRHEMALDSGFSNYRDFKHQERERFDYTVKECFDFHESVKQKVMPLYQKISERRQNELGLPKTDYRPWDLDATPQNEVPLKPFQTINEFLEKAFLVFESLDKNLVGPLKAMNDNKLFDLESRPNKAPGGYNCYLEITRMPFIFMNAAGDQRELVTLMHECGHATHNFLSNHEPLFFYRDFPIEMAETASMSMELMTMPSWHHYYSNQKDLKRAHIQQLEGVVKRLPWIALVDEFQHWIYENPKHSAEERDEQFLKLSQKYKPQNLNEEGLEAILKNDWQKQLHIFEIPFYYIEYGIAQIGALQIYRNFKNNPKLALENYKKGLALGGNRPLPELWAAMDIRFDFSLKAIGDLMAFVEKELDELYASS